ncbi:Panthothenate kinase [Sanguibacter gelidistatuariae]|uniref:Panthothenate kinase n=1 Tax=Sanguibacter gelidistatuariae TaxID=1814289 RepID=A0A1G6KIH5_9MICO|nr:nucleoside/nucleotide kinase family protein [Sanguibacter gelidistatuariae]SDC30365.1 Panthothenate kinase [Sanguibacter gelidistatuariae]
MTEQLQPVYAPDDLLSRVQALLAAARPDQAAPPDSSGVRPPRILVGIAGPPGCGKSTLAAGLVGALNAAGTTATCVPMDGFHLAGAELARLGRQDRKGAPDTFDAAGFVNLLTRLRSRTETVYAPSFDRDLEEPIAGAIAVDPCVEVVVTEGNYLLLDDGPWARVRTLLDETWYLDLPDDVRVERLVARHVRHGRTQAAARAWTLGPDQGNADLVAATRTRRDAAVRGR